MYSDLQAVHWRDERGDHLAWSSLDFGSRNRVGYRLLRDIAAVSCVRVPEGSSDATIGQESLAAAEVPHTHVRLGARAHTRVSL